MTREELKEHCERQIAECVRFAKFKNEEPHGKVYEEHKLILELLQSTPCAEPTTKVTANVSIPIAISLGLPLEDKVDYVAHMIADGLAKKLIPLIDFSLGHDEHHENTLHVYHVFEGSVDVVIKPHNNLDTIKNFLKFTDIGMGEE